MFEQTTISSSANTIEDRTERCAHRFHSDLVSNQMIWLTDGSVNQNLITRVLERLGQLVDDTKVFDNCDQCEDFLKQTNDVTTFLIVSEQFEESFVPRVTHTRHIRSIHIYHSSMDEKQRQLWETESRMRFIHTNNETLLTDLTPVIQQETNHRGNVLFSNVASSDKQEITTNDSPWSSRIEFLDFLCYLPNPPDYFKRLITFLTTFYENNQSQLKHVEHFAATYRPERAIHWYTQDTFVYRLLNAALRQYNIEVLFLFAFLIKDIQNQLRHEHEQFVEAHNREDKSIVKVYRGQLMSPKELQDLKNNQVGPWLVNNSFLSTTRNRNVALIFLNQSPTQADDELQSVLFEIEVNTQIKSRPYSDVSQMSHFEQETEFIFSFGTRFGKTIAFYSNTEHIYVVQLTLNYDFHMKDDKEFQLDSERKMLKKCVGLLETVIEDISIESINAIANELMLLFSSEKEWINALNKSWLASKCIKEQDYTTALLHYNEALHIWHEFINNAELNCTVDIALIYQRLARCYQYHIKDQILAEKHYLDAIQYFKLGIKRATTPYERMKIYEKLSYLEKHRTKLVGYDAENVEMILRYEELSIANMFEHYKTDRAKLGETHRQLAELRKFQQEYDESLVHYQHALEIFRHQPFEFDFYLIICDIIDNMINIYIEEKMCDYLSAMEYQSIKHTYILKHVTYVNLSQQESRCVNQCDLAKSQIELAYIYLLMEERETALMHLSGAVASYREFGNVDVIDYKKFRHGRLLEQFADMSLQVHRHDEAYEYLKKSMRCLQEQKYMLEVILQLKPDDIVSYLKHRREWDKLNAREQMLADKLTKSEKGKKIQMKKQMAFEKFSWSIWYRL